MTIKDKFSSIDQSKLTAEQKSFLSKIKNVTKDFSIKDKDVNDKVEGALDKMIATLKEKMPEAIKSTTAPKTPRKRSVMSVAKEIKKPEESFEEAKKRATKKIADDKQSVKETIKSELDKLNEFIKKKKTLQGIKGTDLLIDSKRKAKPVGRRLSKTGRVYYEYRDSKTDRLSPNYPKNAPYLEMGGGVNDKEFSLAQAIFYIKDAKKDRMSFYYNVYGGDDYFTLQPTFATPTGKLKGFPRMVTITKEGKITGKNLTYELGGSVVTDLAGHTSGGNLGLNAGMPLNGFSNTAYTGLVGETGAMSSGEMFMSGGKIDKNFDLSGYKKWITFNNLEEAKEYVDMDRKKYPRVKESVVIKEGNKFQVWVIPATGVETGNRVYADGGGVAMANQQVIDDASQGYVNYYLGQGTAQGIYKDGGAIMNQYEGKTPEDVWDMLSTTQRYHFLHDHKKEIESTPASVDKATKTAYKFLPVKIKMSFKNHIQMGQYAKGGSVTNERLHVNKGEDYEVRYSKPRPARKGYLGKRNFSRGGLTGESARVEFLREEFASEDLIDELKEKLNLKSEDVKNQDVIAFAYTNYGGSIIDKYAIEYFLENYPRNIVVEETSYNGKNAFVFGKPAKEWMEQSDDYILGFDDFESYYYEKENEDFIQGINYFIQDLKRNYSFNEEEVRDSLQEEFTGYFNVYPDGLDYNEQIMIDYLNKEGLIKEEEFAKGGGVRKVGNREYSYGRNWTNDHRHVNDSENHEVKYTRKGKFLGIFNDGGSITNERKHVNKDEDYEVRYSKPRPARKGYLGKRDFMAGGMVEKPRIYVADLEAYNSGKLVGEWLDLTDYNDADELMDAIQDVLKKSGGEEYAIHDYEYLPSSMYSEYMGYKDFVEIYEMMELAKENDLPLDVVMDIVSQFDRSALDEFTGVYNSEQDFAEELVDEIGITNFIDFQYYLEISETDRRLLAQEEADYYADAIRDEDGGNRLIEEADLDVEEYEEADSERQEEMLDEAREIVYDRIYDRTYDGLDDPYSYFVEELGSYDKETFANLNFVRIDYEKLGDALEDDYTFVRHDGQIYVFNIR
jgi:antirestriction protein